ncbi:hypothetical protein GUJ93_ZPchr0011g27953 [Zizania palustris]|uniref:Uncharacterized protein n=1 Tax=Zizania palustris TaxID=103762 RepID=A0A8J5WIG9_ZIZPA|nr:hypothetical protein GUJ93_ZPchr0011g27953 [Zizania palustris]
MLFAMPFSMTLSHSPIFSFLFLNFLHVPCLLSMHISLIFSPVPLSFSLTALAGGQRLRQHSPDATATQSQCSSGGTDPAVAAAMWIQAAGMKIWRQGHRKQALTRCFSKSSTPLPLSSAVHVKQ